MLNKILAHKLVLIAFLAGFGLAGAVYFLNLPQQLGLALPGAASANAEVAPTATPELKLGPIYALKERIVNLADSKGKRYLKIALTLQFKAEPEATEKTAEMAKEEMAQRAPLIEDAVTTILTTKTFDQVITKDGKEALKTEIRDKLNELLGEGQVERVYITDFVVQ